MTRNRIELSAALLIAAACGQSAIASEPSRIASVSRSGGGDRAGVEMIAADRDRRADFAGVDQAIHAEAEFLAIAVAEPTDAGRQRLGYRVLRPGRAACGC